MFSLRNVSTIICLLTLVLFGGCSESVSPKEDLEDAFFEEYRWKTEADVPALIKDLNSRNATQRAEATYFLSQIGPGAEKAIPALTARLRDREPQVVQGAVYALGRLGPKAATALPQLKKLKQSPNANIQTVVAQAIQRIEAKPTE